MCSLLRLSTVCSLVVILSYSSADNTQTILDVIRKIMDNELPVLEPDSIPDVPQRTSQQATQGYRHWKKAGGKYGFSQFLPKLSKPHALVSRSKIDPGPVWKSACHQSDEYITPATAQNQTGHVLTLWRDPVSSVRQMFPNFVCLSAEESCSDGPNVTRSKCETQTTYVSARIAAADRADSYYEDYIKIAISCTCFVRYRQENSLLRQLYGPS